MGVFAVLVKFVESQYRAFRLPRSQSYWDLVLRQFVRQVPFVSNEWSHRLFDQYGLLGTQQLNLLYFDATSCYDRIIESVASLPVRSYGQNKSLCFIHARHLREARYLLKTQMGVSNGEFKHSWLFSIYRTGQGSPNSPAIWCLISNRLFEAHDAHSHGATF